MAATELRVIVKTDGDRNLRAGRGYRHETLELHHGKIRRLLSDGIVYIGSNGKAQPTDMQPYLDALIRPLRWLISTGAM